VGKTWLAITLAQALARAGRRVLLFDADFGMANVDVQLGLHPARDLGAVIAGRSSLAEAVARHPALGCDVLAGVSGSGALAMLEPARLDRLLAELRNFARGYDVTLLDLGAGVDRPVLRFAAIADRLLVVLVDEPTSLTDAYALIKLTGAGAPEVGIDVVVNLAPTRSDGERAHTMLGRACERFLRRAPGLLGVIRRDDRVRDTIRRQTPLLTRHPGCRAAADVEDLATTLIAAPARPESAPA
jgi:flagellar biosynthesis protein FlhG